MNGTNATGGRRAGAEISGTGGRRAGAEASATGDREADVDESAPGRDGTRFRLGVAYDGTSFHGWGRQPGDRTVQGVLEEAFATIFRRHPPFPRLVVAGRTDAGVHATGQVAHVDLTDDQVDALARRRGRAAAAAPGDALARRINGVLGPHPDVAVTDARPAPEGFDARFSAVWRRYEYRIGDSLSPYDPLQRHRTVQFPVALDAGRMEEAARSLTGLHDFASYCRPREGSTTIRTLLKFGWERRESGVLVASVTADAFCHSMVRALVGVCVAVGEGRLSTTDPVVLRDATERTSAFLVMPARGLTLIEVGYPADSALGARAAQTRALRTLQAN